MMKTLIVQCAECGKQSEGRLPKGGDGSFRYPQRHSVDGKPCPGNTMEAIWIIEKSKTKQNEKAR